MKVFITREIPETAFQLLKRNRIPFEYFKKDSPVPRKILLDKANELGGSDLVKKWIGLHVVGEKQEQIKKIAEEAGYL